MDRDIVHDDYDPTVTRSYAEMGEGRSRTSNCHVRVHINRRPAVSCASVVPTDHVHNLVVPSPLPVLACPQNRSFPYGMSSSPLAPAGTMQWDASSTARVEAWTVEQTAEAFSHVSLSMSADPLEIPLEEPVIHRPSVAQPRVKTEPMHTVYQRREPIRRDSQKRREALLKGKEGSRRRQRWENDRLLSNPFAEPPLPSDWQIQPTYPRHNVPYFLAPLWDAKYAQKTDERQLRAAAARIPTTKQDAQAHKITQELRSKLKKARGAKGLLQDLEQEVRNFVEQWTDKARELEAEGLIEETDSEDEEIVFVGRNGVTSDERRRDRLEQKLHKDKLIFRSLVDDHGAAFGRYLVHSIGVYYGLRTWSVTVGNPACREAYVGLNVDPKTRRPSVVQQVMPQPLWAVI